MRILLVEDDALLGKAMYAGLQQLHYAVDWVRDGALAEQALLNQQYTAVVLDLGLPTIDGLTLLCKLRAQGATVPVVIVTAHDQLAQRIAGLDAGADDFIVKPFDLDELGARLRAVMRRATGRASNVIVHGALSVDPGARSVLLGQQLVALTAREFAILWHLLEQRGKVLSKSRLQESLYSWHHEVESNTVEVHVHNLRRKLGRDLIRTIHGIGYTIDEPADAG
jgi:DNA-binding response OmpR family regulator